MARIRTIKPEFPQSESMGRLSREARLCFILLWTLSDDFGKLRGNSRMLASLLYPYDDDVPELIDGWLSELVNERCIHQYVVDGTTFIEICNWLNHQKISHPTESKIPSFHEVSEKIQKDPEDSRLILGSGSRTKDKERKTPLTGSPKKESLDLSPPIDLDRRDSDVKAMVEIWNLMAAKHGLPQVQKITPERQSLAKLRLKAIGGMEAWAAAVANVPKSPHWLGENDRGWKGNFDSMLRPNYALKLLEGVYESSPRKTTTGNQSAGTASGFSPYLEKQLGRKDEPGSKLSEA